MLSRKLTHWSAKIFQPTGFTADAGWHPRVDHEESTVYDTSANGVTATTTIEYEGDLNYRDTPVLPNRSTTYAFVAKTDGGSYSPGSNPNASPTPVPTSTTATPVRVSETTYLINDTNYSSTIRDAYKAQNMIGLATVSKVKDGSGTVVAQSETVYDESGRSPGYRGNPTTAKAWDSTKGASTSSASYIATHAKFDTYGNQYEVTDALGNTTTTTFDGTYNALPATVTSPVPDSTNTYGSNTAFVTSATFDPTTGLPLTTTDANGLRTEIEYDGATLRPRYIRTYSGSTQVGGTSETIYNDETGNYWVKSKTQIDDSHYAESITYFDGLGRAWKSEQLDSGGNIFTEKEFDADGRVLRVSNPYRTGETKLWTTNVYDNASRVVEIDLPDSSKIYTDYGVSISGTVGVTKTITDQAGKKRKGYSDVLGNMIRVVEDPTGQNLATDYVFDTLGNLRKTTQGDQHRYFMHDSLGRLLYARQVEQDANSNFSGSGYTDPITSNNQWSVKYVYNDNGSILTTTDARNKSVTATYDNLNRIKVRDYSDSGMPDVSFYYDGRGLGAVPDFSNGKTTKIASSISETRYTGFDIFGRLLAHRQSTDGVDYDTQYTYNLGGALIEETYPSGRVVKNTLDATGDLSMVTSKENSSAIYKTYVNDFTYNAAGAVTSLKLGNGKFESTQFNSRLQPTQIALGASVGDTSSLKLDYEYGATAAVNNGNVTKQTITVPGMTYPLIQNYTYDSLNRLDDASETSNGTQTWRQDFSFDRYGNRNFVESNTSFAGFDKLCNSNTELCATLRKQLNPGINSGNNNRMNSGQDYTYDSAGNTLTDANGQTFIYDGENKQVEVRNSSNAAIGKYWYDGDGKRVKKEVPGTGEVTIFVYDAAGKQIAEYSTVVASANDAKVAYVTADHLGSPRINTDVTGAVTSRHDYHPFGEEIYTSQRTTGLGYAGDTVRKQFTGYERDNESGLDFAKARYLSNNNGRFLSPDPKATAGSPRILEPQDINLYVYVANNPLLYYDPNCEEKIVIFVRTFIPDKQATTPPMPTGGVGISVRSRTFGGDDRNAGESPERYRTEHRIEIETDPSKNGGKVLVSSNGDVGVSHELDGTRIIAEAKSSGSSLKQDAERFNLKIGNFDPLVVVTAEGDESNPLLVAPPITYSFSIGIGSEGADKPLFVTMNGMIDGFPGYEITILRPESTLKSERLVWSFDPRSKGNTPLCLLDSYCDEQVEFSGTTP